MVAEGGKTLSAKSGEGGGTPTDPPPQPATKMNVRRAQRLINLWNDLLSVMANFQSRATELISQGGNAPMAETSVKNASHGLPEEDSYPGMMTDSITNLCGLVNANNRRGRKRGRLAKKKKRRGLSSAPLGANSKS